MPLTLEEYAAIIESDKPVPDRTEVVWWTVDGSMSPEYMGPRIRSAIYYENASWGEAFPLDKSRIPGASFERQWMYFDGDNPTGRTNDNAPDGIMHIVKAYRSDKRVGYSSVFATEKEATEGALKIAENKVQALIKEKARWKEKRTELTEKLDDMRARPLKKLKAFYETLKRGDKVSCTYVNDGHVENLVVQDVAHNGSTVFVSLEDEERTGYGLVTPQDSLTWRYLEPR